MVILIIPQYTFKIKTRYYIELQTHETINLLESSENKLTKDKTSDNIVNIKMCDSIERKERVYVKGY